MGYVVACSHGPLRLRFDKHYPATGVLLLGTTVTVFRSRSAARAAIRRTVRWSRGQGLPWATEHQRILRLTPSPEPRDG